MTQFNNTLLSFVVIFLGFWTVMLIAELRVCGH